VDGLANFLKTIGVGRLLAMGLVTAGLVGFFFFLTVRVTTPPMALLFGNLEMQDSSAIAGRLDTLQIPYEIIGNGTGIMVPQDRVERLRMTLASENLPAMGSVGYEIFDRSDALGTTSFVQNINQLRALEGELSRTIRTLDRVAAARVHLVLPQRKLFSRDQRKASASIVLSTRGRLTQAQVLAIQNLVAAAVPDLSVNQISIVDEHGALLAATGETDSAAAFATNLADRRLAYENRIKQQIEALLASSIGPGKVRAEVSAEIDFDRVTTKSELFDPDSQVERSTQTVEERANSRDGEAKDVTVAANLPEAEANKAGGPANTATNSRTEETVNYEISKTIRTEIHEAGRIKRLSVAVLVDGLYSTDKNGKRVYAPRSAEDINRLTALVRSAIGYDEKRGDTVEVVNLPFASIDDVAILEDTSFLGLGLSKRDYFRIGELAILGIVAILILLLVVRPFMSRLLSGEFMAPAVAGASGGQIAAHPGAQPALTGPQGAVVPANADEPDQEMTPEEQFQAKIDVANVGGRIEKSALKQVGEIVQNHPDEAVSILRSWMYNS
jgi:flagellar M-ring protein FliF